jgi:hypothetical protein
MWTMCWAKRRAAVILLALLVFLPAAGCGKGSGSLTGKVYFDDQPMPGGTVTFIPEQGGGGGSASINPEDGTYSVANLRPGKMKVIVKPVARGGGGRPGGNPGGGVSGPPKEKGGIPSGIPAEARQAYEAGGKTPGKHVPVPLKYQDESKTELTVTVEKGEQEFIIRIPAK